MTPQELLEEWLIRAEVSNKAHYASADTFNRIHYYIGIPLVVLSTVIGTAVFGSLEQNVDLAVKIGIGLISVAAAVLAGLQTFLSPIDSAERHRDAATKFSIVQRDIERFFALHPAVDGEWPGFVKELNDRWAQLIAELPTALASHFRRINAEVRRQEPARPPQT